MLKYSCLRSLIQKTNWLARSTATNDSGASVCHPVPSSTYKKSSSEADVRLARQSGSGGFCVRRLTVVLNCLLDARCGFLQVFEVHGRMQLDMRIEGHPPQRESERYLSGRRR